MDLEKVSIQWKKTTIENNVGRKLNVALNIVSLIKIGL